MMGFQDEVGILVGCTELSTIIQLEIKSLEKKLQ